MKTQLRGLGAWLLLAWGAGMAAAIAAGLFAHWGRPSTGAVLVMTGVTVTLAFAAFLVALRRKLLAPVADMERGLGRLAAGDLSVPFHAWGVSEWDRIAQIAERLRARLGTVIAQVDTSGSELSGKLGDLAEKATRAAATAREQSEDAVAMATAVEMMTYGIDSMASQAEQVQTLSSTAFELSNRGAGVIEKAASEIGKIADSVNASSDTLRNLEKRSDEIGSIVKVIGEIAAQTNLLALNAAIEAARAGEHGRGFAVVADEVRKLAERTTVSTEEIAQVIRKIQADTAGAVETLQLGVAQVMQGTSLAQQASAAITEIKDGATEVARAVSEISAALQQQNAANSEHSNKVVRIAQLSQENSAVIEDIAATVRALDGIASRLRQASEEPRT